MACSCDDKAAPSQLDQELEADSGDTADTAEPTIGTVEPGEWLPGGETTNTRLFGRNSFLMPAQNLSDENEMAFFSGNAFFNQAWVEAPATTTARDGLGPLFNARACSSCHPHDGKAEPPEEGDGPFVGVLLRLSIPTEDGYVNDPVYGGQLKTWPTQVSLSKPFPR